MNKTLLLIFATVGLVGGFVFALMWLIAGIERLANELRDWWHQG